jgi:DNA-binding phage protein
MALTRDFKETIIERAKKDQAYRQGMLTRGMAYLMAAGNDEDLHVGRSLIRDYINATIGFTTLAKRTRIPKESIMRMFGANGNPELKKLNAVLHVLLDKEGVKDADHLSIALG